MDRCSSRPPSFVAAGNTTTRGVSGLAGPGLVSLAEHGAGVRADLMPNKNTPATLALYRRVRLRNHTVTVSFDYGEEEQHTIVAPNRATAIDEATRRWGDGWVSEPVFSTPLSIYNDLSGRTAAGQEQQPRR